MPINADYAFALPGMQLAQDTIENAFSASATPYVQAHIMGVTIDGAARDAGHTGFTTYLRPGLLMGINKTTRLAKEWTSGAADGTQVQAGFLLYGVQTQMSGANTQRWVGFLLIGGFVQSDKILIPGQTGYGLVGAPNEAAHRAALANRFIFDDMFYV